MRRWLPVASVVAVAAIAGVVVFATRGQLDLAVYRYGGRAVLDGIPLYEGADPATGLPFTYPPFGALLMAPVALLPGWIVAGLWTAASAAALLGVIKLVDAAAPRAGRIAGLAVAAVAIEPVWQTFSFGQVNLFLMLAIVVDLLLPDRRWAGALVGVAAGIKLTPLVFVVLLVLVGRRTAAGRAVLAFVGTIAIGLVVLPAHAWTYWTDAVGDPARVGGPAYSSNQSVYGELTRLLDGPPPTLLWVAVAGPIAFAALVVGASAWRSGDRVLGTALGGIAMLVASPISWSHHWVWAVLVGLALLQRSRRWALAWSSVFVATPIWWLPHGEEAELAWGPLEHVLGNAYLIAALVLAAWAAWSVSGGRRGRVVAGVDREHALDGA